MKPDFDIAAEADRCVMCGLCLPHCPTYCASTDEGDSPRGRIALIRALAAGELEKSERLRHHIEGCLLCRACEARCPSRVEYGRLMSAGRALLGPPEPTPLERIATDAAYRRRLHRAGWLAQISGLRSAGRSLGITRILGVATLERLAPPFERPRRWRDYYPPAGGERGRVALFTGCATDLFGQRALADAITLLNRIGYGVHVPAAQGCCGALHHNQGDPATAERLERANRDAFAQLEVEAILHSASACAAHAAERLPSSRELCEFLATAWPLENPPPLAPLPVRVALHEPCSHRNQLGGNGAAHTLLERIPELKVEPLAGNDQCCGAAGRHMIDHPEVAEALRRPKLEAFAASKADWLVTTNIGCALHLGAGGGPRPIHPVSLLARQLA